MIEYKLIGKNNRPVTLDNYKETSKSIESIFPETDINKMGAGLRKTYGVNGESFHVYYGYKKTRIFLPQKERESIKERLEVIAELRLEEITN